MNYRWLATIACALVLTGNTAFAQEGSEKQDPKPDKPVVAENDADETKDEAEEKTPAQQLTALEAEYSAAMAKFMTAYSQASEDERSELMSDYPQPEAYADRFIELANDNPDSPAAVDALVWVASKVRSGSSSDKAWDVLLTKHIESEKLQSVCSMLGYASPSAQAEDRLRKVVKNSPHDSVKAAATYALAKYLSSVASGQSALKDEPDSEHFDEAMREYYAAADASPEEIERLYQMLMDEFGELKPSERSKQTYKSMAQGAMFELQNLTVGKMAPDIEGEDLDGVSFKLSDYRGKVVVIDFWGDW